MDDSQTFLEMQRQLQAIIGQSLDFRIPSSMLNANYSATRVSEGPAVQLFEWLYRNLHRPPRNRD